MHTCPNCGQVCNCASGDIDDKDCQHYQIEPDECIGEDDDDGFVSEDYGYDDDDDFDNDDFEFLDDNGTNVV